MIWLISALFAQEPSEPVDAGWDDEPTRVFVGEFQAINAEAGSLAALLSGYLVNQLDSHGELDAISAYEAPDIQGYSASTYLLSCPSGEYVGCAYVIGDTVEADFAALAEAELPPDAGVHAPPSPHISDTHLSTLSLSLSLQI